MPEINEILAEREARYGSFMDHARVTQAIKYSLINAPRWNTLADDQREALEMIAHKIGRIVCGDPNYIDSWVDIEGYARLVSNRLGEDARTPPSHGPEAYQTTQGGNHAS